LIPTRIVSTKVIGSGALVAQGTKADLYGFTVLYGTAAQAGATFLDGGSGGTERAKRHHTAVTAAEDLSESEDYTAPVHFSDGIYVTIAGTGTVVFVRHAKA